MRFLNDSMPGIDGGFFPPPVKSRPGAREWLNLAWFDMFVVCSFLNNVRFFLGDSKLLMCGILNFIRHDPYVKYTQIIGC